MVIDEKESDLMISFYLKDEFSDVLSLWSKYEKEVKLDTLDARLLETIADSYEETGRYSESLPYLKILYNRTVKCFPTNDDELNRKFDFYTLSIADVSRKLNLHRQEYRVLVNYGKLGGHDEQTLRYCFLLEEVLIKKYIKPAVRVINALFIAFCVMKLVFKIKVSLAGLVLFALVFIVMLIDLFYPNLRNSLAHKLIKAIYGGNGLLL
jgi:hypothetical protein